MRGETATPRLSALQVRNLVLGNVAEGEAGVLRQATRGLLRSRRGRGGSALVVAGGTRLHDRFEDRAAKVLMQDGVRATLRYEDLGSVFTPPARHHSRERSLIFTLGLALALGDRFTDYPIDEGQLSEAGDGLCEALGRLGYPNL